MSYCRRIAYAFMGLVCGLLGMAFALDQIPSWVSALGPTAIYFMRRLGI